MSVTPQGGTDVITVITNPAPQRTETFRVKNIGTQKTDTYSLTMGCTGGEVCISQDQTSVTLSPGASAYVTVTFTPGQPAAPNNTGTVTLLADDGIDNSSTGWFNVTSIPGPGPVVSLAPYSAGAQTASDGVVYGHSVPSIASMGVQRSLTLVYNSAAAHPTALITADVYNNTSPDYPTTYLVQVQRADYGTFLPLLNGTNSVYYTAVNGPSTLTRVLAAVDVSGLATGAYPINLLVTSNYWNGTATTSVPTRLLVNNLSAGALGAGVGMAGVAQLVPNPTSGYGMLLVDGSGALSYFDRSCLTCTPFVSPAGESRTLTYISSSNTYRLTALDGSYVEFSYDGRPLWTYGLPGIHALSFQFDGLLPGGHLTMVYDTTGRGFTLTYSGGVLTQISDFSGRTTGVSIVSGQLKRVTDPNGFADTLSYGANSMLAQVSDGIGRQWNYWYNVLNQQDSSRGPSTVDFTGLSVRPKSSVVTMEQVVWQPGITGTSGSPKANVRPDTVLASLTGPLGNVSRVVYNRFGSPTRTIDPLGQVATATRDTLGNVTRTAEPNGHVVTYSWSRYLMTNRYDSTLGASRSYTYNSSNQVTKIMGGPVRLDQFYHDGSQGPAGTLKMVYAGCVTFPIYGDCPTPNSGDTVAYHYPDALGRDTAVTDGMHHRTRWVFASAASGGNLAQAVDANALPTSFQYDARGLLRTTTLVTGAATSRTGDVLNRDSVVTDLRGGTVRYTYSPLGLTQIVDQKGQTYQFDRNNWGLVVATHDLATPALVDSTLYDVAGQVRRVRTRRNQVDSMSYDALGRLLRRSFVSGPDSFPTETFRYGLNGAWVVAQNANAYDSTTFDAAGRATGTWHIVGNVTYQTSYTYDYHGRLTSRSGPNGGSISASPLTLVYDPNLNLVDTIRTLGTAVGLSYDREQKPTGASYAGGAWAQTLAFDAQHRVTSYDFTVSQLHNDFAFTWTYDSLGHVVSAVTPATAATPRNYRYDAAGQLTVACAGSPPFNPPYNCYDEYGQMFYNPYQQSYWFDAAGNRSEGGTVGAGNRLQQFRGYALAYDSNGAVAQRSGLGSGSPQDTMRLQWNAGGQLTRVEVWTAGGAHTIDTMFYDAVGRRVGKSVNGVRTWYVYDGNRVVLDVNADGSLAVEYAWTDGGLLGVRTPAVTALAILDPLAGRVLGLVNAVSGFETKRYDAIATTWGSAVSDTGLVVRYKLGSQEYDQETGLYHLGARYYDPLMGRFLSEDPIGIAGGLNLYAYASNDPMNRRDPTGLSDQMPPIWVYGQMDPHALDWTFNLDLATYFASHWEPFAANDGTGVDPVGDGGGGGGGSPMGQQARRPQTRSACDYQRMGEDALRAHQIVQASISGEGYAPDLPTDLLDLRRGGALDAQATGASPAYANYAYGVYMAAAGYNLGFALSGANMYASRRSRYPKNTVMSPLYRSTPAANVGNIIRGFNDARGGQLCAQR